MLTLIIFFAALCSFLFNKGIDYFSNKHCVALGDKGRMDRYLRLINFCDYGFCACVVITATLAMLECVLIAFFVGFSIVKLDAKIGSCQLENEALESFIVEYLDRDVGFNDELEVEGKEVDLAESFDYALIYLIHHPELRENESFAEKFDLYLENYEKIQQYEDDLRFQDRIRFLVYFGRSS